MTTRVFVELDTNLRDRIEGLVELLIELCDQIDGDPDAEPDDDADGDEPDHNAPHLRGGNGPARVRHLRLI